MGDQETEQIYERAGIGAAAHRGQRPAVVVVDFSRGFTEERYATGADYATQIAATNRVIEAARACGAPVVFTTIGFEENLRDAGAWLQKFPGLSGLRLGTPAVELDPRLAREPQDTVIVKKGASAFFGTNLASILAAQRVDTVILCGATTSGCVRASSVDSVQYGFPTIVGRDCVGDRAQPPHEANLFDMQAKYADVISSDEIVEFLTQLPQRAEVPA